MKVLHLFSNHKWTGPAEPVINLCWALQELGVDITIACARGSEGIDSPVTERAREKGLKTVRAFRLRKHFSVGHNVRDIWFLRKYIEAEKFDLVHAHMQNDHLIAGFAARRAALSPPILRTSYSGDGIRPTVRNRLLLTRYTDGLVTCSRTARSMDISNFGMPEERIWTVYGAVDTSRFNPARQLPDMRSRFGLSKDHFVAGVVARIQGHRRFDVLLEAAAKASAQTENLRVMIIGRGTGMGRVVVEPSRRLRIENCVVLPGYFHGKAYVAMVNSLDAKVFLVPGTDGTCRALLEAMALAKPCIVSQRGVLPEIVTDGVEGFVVKDDSTSFSDAMVKLARDPRLRREMGLNARKKVLRDFSLKRQVSLIQTVYDSLIQLGPRSSVSSRHR